MRDILLNEEITVAYSISQCLQSMFGKKPANESPAESKKPVGELTFAPWNQWKAPEVIGSHPFGRFGRTSRMR